MVFIPLFRLVWIMELIWWVFLPGPDSLWRYWHASLQTPQAVRCHLPLEAAAGNNTFQDRGQLYPDLSCWYGGKTSMIRSIVLAARWCECGKHKMAGLRCSHSDGNRFQVTHLTHKDHIRILPQSSPQRLGVDTESDPFHAG